MRTDLVRCRYCKTPKPSANFPIAGTVKGKVYRRRKCDTCYSAMKSARRRSIRDWLRGYKKTCACSVCGNDDFRVLDFHHSDDNKEFNIGEATKRAFSIERIVAEIGKCIVLCANCHRIETYENSHRAA